MDFPDPESSILSPPREIAKDSPDSSLASNDDLESMKSLESLLEMSLITTRSKV